jgi:hypothetical protein
LRQRSAANLLASVPTAAERTGDFSQVKTASGAPITIYDPITTTLVGSTYTRTPFPGNIIPANRIDAVSGNVVKYWPSPNTPGGGGGQINNYVASSAAPYNIDQYDIKGDQGDQRAPASLATLVATESHYFARGIPSAADRRRAERRHHQ